MTLSPPVNTCLPTRNNLDKENSLYLRQHKNNPVFWQAWSDDIFECAQKNHRPILLSSGYSSCHWCHVMAHENFEDPTIAQLMNSHFINVKIDREELPDIDAYYMTALHMLQKQGGWPLTIFLTPNGRAFWGGTYFPKKARYGLPSFADILVKISNYYQEQTHDCNKNAQTLQTHIDHYFLPQKTPSNNTLPTDFFYKTATTLYKNADHVNGGFGEQQKFPHLHILDFIDTLGWLYNDTQLSTFSHETVKKMCMSGLYDHVGGGFFRYCVDNKWTIPHFEKMLYDNALFVHTLTYHAKKDTRFFPYLTKTIHFLLTEMQTHSGGFSSSIDACDDNGEGRYYLWTHKELQEILNEDEYHLLCDSYVITHEGHFDGYIHLNAKTLLPRNKNNLKKLHQKLHNHRNSRPKPVCDTKILTDWNGLCISALAYAGLLFQESSWYEAAQKAFHHILNNHTPDNTLRHCYTYNATHDRPTWQEHIYATDYAYMIEAALHLAQHTDNQSQYLDIAIHLAQIIEKTFFDPHYKSYRFSPLNAKTSTPPLFILADNPLPSAHSVMLKNYITLYHFTSHDTYYNNIQLLKSTASQYLESDIFSHANLALSNITEPYWHALHLNGHKTHQLVDTVLKQGFRHFHLASHTSNTNKASITFCQQGYCSAPLTSANHIASTLKNIQNSHKISH